MSKRTHSLGILYQDNAGCGITHEYFAAVLNGFKIQAENKGYEITFINCHKDIEGRKRYLEHIQERKIEGVAIICSDFKDPEVIELLGSDVPVVTIDEPYEGVISILSDNEQGIKNLVYHIAGMGHDKIAYIHGDMNTVTSIRLNGFKDACKKMGIKVPKEYIRSCNYRDINKASFETEELLRLPDPPTCIIYPDDYAAIGGINIIKAYGMSIPDDISIAGYDGIDIPSRYDPHITTIAQDMKGMGTIAADRLISLIEAPEEMTDLNDVVVETRLNEGNTIKLISKEK
ncbi:MAG: substrate-binding domain-containing protein [Lachnospiraceae bacterium]|nr:substrate-binding domain-containing protein [Lachnospiraceae bacterium]